MSDWWTGAPVVSPAPSPRSVARQPQARRQAAPRYSGPMPTGADEVFSSLIAQESGGRAGVRGPQTQYGQALGRTQVLPDTAKGIARNLGIPYREDLLTGTSPEAASYQDQLGRAYLQEGFQNTGNARDALMYYHGGPNRDLWGPKTNAYADEVLTRWNQGGGVPATDNMADMPSQSGSEWWASAPVVDPAAANGAVSGSSREAAIDLAKLYEDDIPRLKQGAWVKNGEEVYQLPGDAYQNAARASDERVGDATYIRRPNAVDALGNFSMAAAEQVPFLDEAATGISAALKGTDYSTEAENFRVTRALGNQTDRGARVAGGLAGFAGSLAVPVAGAGFIGRGAGLADRIGRTALVGAGSGILAGAGNTDGGFADRAQGAAIGGLVGLGAGGTLAAAAPLAPRVASGLSEAGATIQRGLGIAPREATITPRATDSAIDYVERLLRSSGNDLTGNPVAAMGKPITAAEAIGPSGVSNMAALTRRSGRAGTLAADQLGARAVEQPNRVVQDFADLTGMDPSGSADVIQNLATAGRARAAPLYQAAYATPVRITDEVQEILDTPAGKQALRNAIQIAQNDRVDPTSLGFDFDAAGDVIHIRQPSMQTLDYVKRGLDDVLDGYRDSTTRRLNLNNASRPIVGLVTDLRDSMIRQTGGETGTYAQALAAGGDPIRLETAFTQAPRLFQSGTSARTFRQATARMGEAERNALVAGYADKLFTDAQAGRLGTRQLGQIDLPVTREKLSDLMGAEKADDFLNRVRSEVGLSRTGARMAPGTNSITAEALEAMREQDQGVGILNDLARNVQSSGVIGGAVRTGADAIAAPVAGFIRGFQAPAPQPVRDEIARLLLTDPDGLEAILAQARARSGSATQDGGALGRVLRGSSGIPEPGYVAPGAQSSSGSARQSPRRAQR